MVVLTLRAVSHQGIRLQLTHRLNLDMGVYSDVNLDIYNIRIVDHSYVVSLAISHLMVYVHQLLIKTWTAQRLFLITLLKIGVGM